MATVATDLNHPNPSPTTPGGGDAYQCAAKATSSWKQGEGLRQYYLQQIHDLQLQLRHKTHNLNRLEAQRNDLNSRVRMLKEELQLLQEPGSYVGEVVKVMGKSKVLVKILENSILLKKGGESDNAEVTIKILDDIYHDANVKFQLGIEIDNFETILKAQMYKLDCCNFVFMNSDCGMFYGRVGRDKSHKTGIVIIKLLQVGGFTKCLANGKLHESVIGMGFVTFSLWLKDSLEHRHYKNHTIYRVARNDSYMLHLILPSKVDPLVSLMKVEKVPDSTYDVIGGLDPQIKEIKEVIELPIKHPELFESLGIAQPKGVLLYGPPGTGKTLLARAVAHHTDCTFIRVSGSELVQKYIGEGSRMVRELFVMAREHAPSIIFMDEIDSIGSARMESGSGNGDSEVQRTMLELLNQLDGFEASNKIKVLMATNRIDILDQALLRPGRIDRKIEFPNPNEESRFDILKIHSRKMNLMRGIDLKKIAEKMNGASGAELKAVCTEAGMFALRERRVHVTQEDFEMAVAKVMKKETEKNMSLRKLWK
ncbi:hypothetical protein FNV43_RR12358 [Rhamnella rubrinervis]|uniref:AAA+ ATPase domain-containing protein n=1 Tax=Rhamnella rubrinervis TaxID=2594499 RepID=A0A8K0H885_9ROSA|nr:hypothetical protein FNV43_RR12358 [Rhamnella rubrinervis]